MSFSRKTTSLSKPKKGEAIPLRNIAFAKARARNKAHSLLLEAFRDSGLSKKDVAEMMNKRPEQITRWLAGPGNVTIDTLSALIFVSTGRFVDFTCREELNQAKRNHDGPDYIKSTQTANASNVDSVPTWHYTRENATGSVVLEAVQNE